MTRVVALTAVELEARALARHLGLGRLPDTPWPHFAGGALQVACVGLRASQLAARAGRLRDVDLVISAGICGALAPSLSAGDLVIPETVLDASGRCWPTARLARLGGAGTLLTVPAVVETAAEKSRHWLETGARAIDMESAPILAWAAGRGLTAAVIRGVSDSAGRGVPAALAASVRDDGRLRPLRAVTAALARPTALADLVELRAGTDAALRSVAGALAALVRAA